MEALLVDPGSDKFIDPKWRKMVILSLILHLGLFSTILFVPEPSATRKIREVVYNVDLVQLPKTTKSGIRSKVRSEKRKGLHVSAKALPAKRIGRTKKKEKPVVIAKRTVRVETEKNKKPDTAPTELLNRAMAEITRENKKAVKITTDHPPPVPHTQARPSGGTVDEGIAIRLYKLDVFEKIKSNWSYPIIDEENPVAIVVVNVKKDGTILDFHLKTGSNNILFDKSVLMAVTRSNPLPPFPEGYRKTHEEIEINFNLSELKRH